MIPQSSTDHSFAEGLGVGPEGKGPLDPEMRWGFTYGHPASTASPTLTNSGPIDISEKTCQLLVQHLINFILFYQHKEIDNEYKNM